MLNHHVSVRTTLVMLMMLIAAGGMLSTGWADDEHGPPFISLNLEVFHPESAPILAAGRLLAPLQDLIGAIGGHVSADAEGRNFTVLRGAARLELAVDRIAFTLNNAQRSFTVPPFRIREAVYVDAQDIVTAFGGQYRWDAARMTGDLLIRRVEETARTVRGTLAYFDPATPPLFLVRPEGDARPMQHWGAAAIEYLRRGISGPSQPSTVGELRAGDRVELGLDAEGKVIRVVTLLNEVQGVVSWAGEGLILLDDRTHYYLIPEVVVVTDTGETANTTALEKGRRVTLTIDPEKGTATRVVLHTTEARPEEGPRIVRIAPEKDDPLRAGRILTVHLEGTAGGQATFDIGERIRGVAMREQAPGKYRGTHIVRSGSDVVGAPIIGRLRVGEAEAPPVPSEELLTVDTVKPEIQHVSPANGETIGTVSPTLLVRYGDGEGSGIDRAQVRLTLNRKNITNEATIDEVGAFYQARDLQAGAHTLEVRVVDRAGNEQRQTVRFTVQPEAANKIVAVQHDARDVLTARDTLTVTLDAREVGRRAWFVIGDKWREVNMTQVGNTNAYRGSYVVRAGDEIRDANVTGYLEDREGRMHFLEATTRVSISTALPGALSITSPQDGAQLAESTVEVRGQAPPNRKVRITAQSVLIIGSKTVYNGVTTSDAAGNWQTQPINLRKGLLEALFATRFAITAELLDAADNPQETQRVTVTIGGEE